MLLVMENATASCSAFVLIKTTMKNYENNSHTYSATKLQVDETANNILLYFHIWIVISSDNKDIKSQNSDEVKSQWMMLTCAMNKKKKLQQLLG